MFRKWSFDEARTNCSLHSELERILNTINHLFPFRKAIVSRKVRIRWQRFNPEIYFSHPIFGREISKLIDTRDTTTVRWWRGQRSISPPIRRFVKWCSLTVLLESLPSSNGLSPWWIEAQVKVCYLRFFHHQLLLIIHLATTIAMARGLSSSSEKQRMGKEKQLNNNSSHKSYIFA